MNFTFYFEHNYAKKYNDNNKKKIKREEEEERFKFFEKYNIKEYNNKEEFQHFLFNVFENFRIIRKIF